MLPTATARAADRAREVEASNSLLPVHGRFALVPWHHLGVRRENAALDVSSKAKSKFSASMYSPCFFNIPLLFPP